MLDQIGQFSAGTLSQGFVIAGVGLGAVFTTLIIFFFMTKALIKIFPVKDGQ